MLALCSGASAQRVGESFDFAWGVFLSVLSLLVFWPIVPYFSDGYDPHFFVLFG